MTSRTGGSLIPSSLLQSGVQHIAQLVADHVDGNDGDQEGNTGEDGDPVFARQHVVETVGDQQPQRWFGRRQADAEEGQRRFQRDRMGRLHGATTISGATQLGRIWRKMMRA